MKSSVLQRLTSVLFLLLGFGYSAAASPDSLYFQARPEGSQIILRWAPGDFATWRDLRTYGVQVERRALGSGVDFAPISDTIREYSLAAFRQNTDTLDAHIVAVAEALYGEAEMPAEPNGAMERAKQLHEEQSQRLFLALINADLSAEAAEALGWKYVDTELERHQPYDYRLRLCSPTAYWSDTIRLRASDRVDDSPVYKVTANESHQRVVLRWPATANANRFAAYRIEVSSDGQRYRPLENLPLVKEPIEHYFEHPVELTTNYEPRYYRVIGIDAFANTTAPSKAVRAQGIDEAAPPPPQQLRGEDLRTGRFSLTWIPAATSTPDLLGYQIFRGLNPRDLMIPVSEVLPKGQTSWTDAEPIQGETNYYAIEVVDTAGNTSRTPVIFIAHFDDQAPAQPTGLTGRIDTLGRVYLMWVPGDEPDLLGYRVFRSNNHSREFVEVTTSILHQNFFFDSIPLTVLDEVVQYRVMALDRNFNPSETSNNFGLTRPDRMPPGAPRFEEYRTINGEISLAWKRSASSDVTRQEIWRRMQGEQDWLALLALGPEDSTWIDTTALAMTRYAYRIEIYDEVGNSARSKELVIMSGDMSEVPLELASVKRVRDRVDSQAVEQLEWPASESGELIVYQGPAEDQLRPIGRVARHEGKYRVPEPGDYYALQAVGPRGAKGQLSRVLPPVNPDR